MIQILESADKYFTISIINVLRKIGTKIDIMNKEMENNRGLEPIK